MKVSEIQIALEPGIQLTLNCEIIGLSGIIFFEKDQKVTVEEFEIKEGHWGRMSGVWYDDELTGVRIKEHHGTTWQPTIFKELNKTT